MNNGIGPLNHFIDLVNNLFGQLLRSGGTEEKLSAIDRYTAVRQKIFRCNWRVNFGLCRICHRGLLLLEAWSNQSKAFEITLSLEQLLLVGIQLQLEITSQTLSRVYDRFLGRTSRWDLALLNFFGMNSYCLVDHSSLYSDQSTSRTGYCKSLLTLTSELDNWPSLLYS